jgi:chromosome segregation ATPase
MTESTSPSTAPASTVPPVEPSTGPAAPTGWAPWKKRALRWSTGLLLVFALGLVALWLVQVQPLRRQVTALEQEREMLQARVLALEAQVARLEEVESRNEALRAANATLEQSAALLNARIGTLTAQHVLASGGDDQEAVEALSRADEQLAILEAGLMGPKQESIRSLRYRLAMAVEEVDSNPFAAQRDLEVLADGLQMLEKELAGG